MPDQEQIAQFVQKLLMIAGGFAAGYLGAWLACIGFDKTIVKGQSPDGLHKWARRIGGALVALVVAFFVFRGGTGTGNGEGNGSGDGTGQTTSTSPQTSQTPATQQQPEVAVEAVPVRVTVYAGNAVERGTQKFFKVNDGGEMAELGEVSAEVRRQKEKASKAGVVIVYTLDDTASSGTTTFRILESEAKALGVPMLSDEQFRQLRK